MFTIIVKCLHQSEDIVTRHIAAKVVENVVSTTGRYCQKFLTNEVGLVGVFILEIISNRVIVVAWRSDGI